MQLISSFPPLTFLVSRQVLNNCLIIHNKFFLHKENVTPPLLLSMGRENISAETACLREKRFPLH
jgi:hypothetical protein